MAMREMEELAEAWALLLVAVEVARLAWATAEALSQPVAVMAAEVLVPRRWQTTVLLYELAGDRVVSSNGESICRCCPSALLGK